MNKRLRKRKRVGEFKELSFELSADLRPQSSTVADRTTAMMVKVKERDMEVA